MTLQGSLGPARWLFSSRSGGVSLAPFTSLNIAGHVGDDPTAVAENRRRVSDRIGAPLVVMGPNHGVGVGVVTASKPDLVHDVDALVTAQSGIALLALAADCVPVIAIDPTLRVVASIHAGWPGVRDGVVLAALDTMTLLGSRPQDITMLLGPAICGQCYPVSQERHDEVVAVAPAAAATALDGQPALDLRNGLKTQLHDLGITVEVVGPCVAEDDEWFSFRRDGRTGRNGAVVVLEG